MDFSLSGTRLPVGEKGGLAKGDQEVLAQETALGFKFSQNPDGE